MKNFLNDAFQREGTSLEEFRELLEYVVDHTSRRVLNAKNIVILTLTDVKDDAILFQMHRPGAATEDDFYDNKTNRGYLKVGPYKACEGGPELLNEVERLKTLILEGKTVHFMADKAINGLARRCEVYGPGTIAPSCARNMFLAQKLREKAKDDFTVVFGLNEDRKLRKVFAVHSDRYLYVPQTKIFELLDEAEKNLGTANAESWSYTHDFTRLSVCFPEKGEEIAATYGLQDNLTPKLVFMTSDTGDCAVTVKMGWESPNGHFAQMSEIKSRHLGAEAYDGVVKDMQHAYGKYTQLPIRLCELMRLDIQNPSLLIEGLFEECELIKTKRVGMKEGRAILTEVLHSLDASHAYNGYEIAMILLGLGQHVVFCDDDVGRRKQNCLEDLSYRMVFSKLFEKAANGGLTGGVTLVP